MFEAFERNLSIVPRWSIVPTINKQNVAEHSFYVALYTDKICRLSGSTDLDRLNAVSYALRHDMGEVLTGDIPGPAKRRMTTQEQRDTEENFFHLTAPSDYVPAPSEWAEQVVKLADRIDELMFMRRELAMGNTMVTTLHVQLIDTVERLARPLLGSANTAKLMIDIRDSARLDLPA